MGKIVTVRKKKEQWLHPLLFLNLLRSPSQTKANV